VTIQLLEGLKEYLNQSGLLDSQNIQTKYPKEKQIIYDKLGEDLCCSLAESGAILAGGALTSLFTNKEINDWDIYFKNKEGVSKFILGLFDKHKTNSLSWEDIRPVHATTKAYLCQNSKGEDIQLILYKLFETPQDIFKSFDFTVNMVAYDFEKEEFIFHKDFWKHASQRFLSFNENTDYPLVSALRVKKYTDKGYTISKAQMLRIMFTVNKKNFNSWEDVIDECGSMYGLDPSEIFPTDQEFSLDKVLECLEDVFIPSKIYELKQIDFRDTCKQFKNVITDNLYNFSETMSPWAMYKEDEIYES